MPLYEFLCTDCGNEFEKMVSYAEANQRPTCPNCQGQDTHKKISKIASLGFSAGGSLGSSSSDCGSSGGFR